MEIDLVVDLILLTKSEHKQTLQNTQVKAPEL